MAKKMKRIREEPSLGTIEPLALDRVNAAAFVGLKRTTFEEMNRDGRLGPQSFVLGGGRRWDRLELRAWFEAGRPRREVWVSIREAEMAKSAALHAVRAIA